MSDNICHCWPNRIDEASIINLSGSYDSNWPLENIHDPILAKVARTFGTGDIKIGISLPYTRNIGVVCVANHNLSVRAECKVSIYKDQSLAILRNTPGWEKVWPRVYQSSQMVWQSPNFWFGRTEEEQRQYFTHLYSYFPSTNVESKYIEIEISDPDNPDGYFEVGRLFIGELLQPTYNPEYGKLAYGYLDNTEVAEATDGTEYFYKKRKRRKVTFSLTHMNVDEAFGGAYDAQRSQGISGEILHLFSKTPGAYSYARSFLCRYAQLDDIAFPYMGANETTFQLREIV